jgi:thiamine-monophosphate kinase
VTEFELIARFFSPATTHTVLAGGDDAALVAVRPGMELVVSTDMLVAGRHFYEDAPAYDVGYKSLAVNLSDMAAMGATPRWATLSLALPAADEVWLEAFARGFLELAGTYDVDLIGGDTTRGPLNVCVQIMGEAPAGKALRRSGARPGDDVWVSGALGGAALALAHLRGEAQLRGDDLAAALQRLQRPLPRVALGQALIGRASSAIDVSDGLAADLGHVAARSGAKGVIEWMRVPVPGALAQHRDQPLARRCALAGGDDYELCFTADPALRPELDALAARQALPLTRIGRIEAGQGVVVRDASGAPLELQDGGFDHFR